MSLYAHIRHPHQPQSANAIHQAERDEKAATSRVAGFNQRLAVLITRYFGTVTALYVLMGWQIGWMLLATLGVPPFSHDPYPFVFCLFLSNLIQLWALPALQTGQNVLARHAEIQAEETFHNVERILHDIEQVAQHQTAQDDEFIARLTRIEAYLQSFHLPPTVTAVVTAGANTQPFVALPTTVTHTPAAPPASGASGAQRRRRRRRAPAARKQETTA